MLVRVPFGSRSPPSRPHVSGYKFPRIQLKHTAHVAHALPSLLTTPFFPVPSRSFSSLPLLILTQRWVILPVFRFPINHSLFPTPTSSLPSRDGPRPSPSSPAAPLSPVSQQETQARHNSRSVRKRLIRSQLLRLFSRLTKRFKLRSQPPRLLLSYRNRNLKDLFPQGRPHFRRLRVVRRPSSHQGTLSHKV